MRITYTLINSLANRPPEMRLNAQRCAIEFTLDQFRSAAAEVAAGIWAAPRGDGGPVVNTWRRHHPDNVVAWVGRQSTDPFQLVDDHRWRSLPFILEQLLADKRFESIECSLCGSTFHSNEISAQPYEWIGGKLAASWGRVYLCPQGHRLYLITTEVS